MKKKVKYIIAVLLLVVGFFTAKKIRKLLQLKKFKLSVASFGLTDKLDPTALQQGVDSNLTLNLQNYSNQDFRLDQVSIDLYTPSGRLLAQQLHRLRSRGQAV